MFAIVFQVVFLSFTSTVRSSMEESTLIQNLLANYDPKTRPVIQWNETVQIDVTFQLSNVMNIDTKSQTLAVNGWLTVDWVDPYLTWNETDFGGVSVLILSASEIWTPGLLVRNSVAETSPNKDWVSLYKVQVFADGYLTWSIGGALLLSCPVNTRYFPFDEQTCEIIIENWAYTGAMVNLTSSFLEKDGILELYQDNSDWDIVSTSVIRRDNVFGDFHVYPDVIFKLHFKRRPLFYLVNIFVPSFCLEVLVLLMFHLPPESGEKVSMGVTILVAFSVLSLSINSYIPESSRNMPVVLVFIYSLMLMTTLGISETIVVLYCFHHNPNSRPPTWLTCIMMGRTNRMCRKRTIADKSRVTANTPSDMADHKNFSGQWKEIGKRINNLCFCFLLIVFIIVLLTVVITIV